MSPVCTLHFPGAPFLSRETIVGACARGAQFRDQIVWPNLNLVVSLRSQGHRRSGAEGSEGVLATEGSDSLRTRGESAGVSAYPW